MRPLAPALALLLVPSLAGADDTPRWSRDCDSTGCLIAARTADPEQERLLATVILSHGPDFEEPLLVVFTPLGIAARPGVRVTLDGETLFETVMEVCLPDGCRTAAPLSRADFDEFASAQTLEVRYFAYGNDVPLLVPFPVTGLAAALDHLP